VADTKIKNRLVVTGSEAIVNGSQVTTLDNTQSLTNKTISGASNTITNIPSSALASGVDAAKIADGSVSNTEFQYLDGVTSSIQTQLNAKALDSAVIKKDGSVAYTAAQSMGGFKLTSLANGTAASDAVNKGQLDAALEGLKPKAAVRVATTANIVIATSLNAGDTLDGITLANGDRVLVKDQTAAETNGIYIVSATPTRSTDFDQLSPIDEINGSLVAVQEGTVNAGKVFVQSGTVAVLDTDPINFVFFNSVSSLVGGDGITVSGSNISVDHDGNGLTFASGQLSLELDGTTLAKSATGLKLNDTAVTTGTYGSATQVSTVTVDQQGRITSASNTSIAIPSTQITDFTEAAQDAIGATLTDSSTIDLTYNDGANTISAIVIDGSLTDAKIASGAAIDATKIANGIVSNTEFQHLDGVTSAIQTQLNNKLSAVTGDIQPTSFSIANNQVTAANVTGLAFATATTRSAKVLVDIQIDATTDLYEAYELLIVQKASSFDMSQMSTGDDSGIVFTITNAGQVQYTSSNNAGFVSGTLKFRAHTIPVA
jgi:hypothetical protein